LTEIGRSQARRLVDGFVGRRFALILSSPMTRALETARLAGFGDRVEVVDDLREWDYGEYEGLTTVEIRQRVPRWTVWTHPVPGGETSEAVGSRADRVIERIRSADGDVLVWAHGHLLRVLAARWIGLDATAGRRFALGTGSVSVLGWDHEAQAIRRWNVEIGE
jgi:probable phosphoglycerate mutase